MRTRTLAYVLLVFCGLLSSRAAFSQGGRSPGMSIPFRTPGSDSVKVVKILNANTFHSEQKDKDSAEISYWTGNVQIQQANTFIYCDSMIMNPKENIIESFGHVHINDNDSTNIYSDYMKYQVDVRTVHFVKNVKLTDGKGVLTTDEMQYDLNKKVGVYNHGGKIVNNGSVLTSEEGTYFEDTKDVHFKKNVILKDPQYDLSADSLLYNTQTQVSTFITETHILFKDSTHRSVVTKSGYYDLKNRKAEFGKRPIITDGSQRIIGDSVRFDDSTGISIAKGNAVYTDTVEKVTLKADYMISDQKKKNFLATQHPLMILKQDKDSIYITADTLYSGRLIDAPHLKRRVFLADSLHRVYIDSLQKASADSLHNATLQSRTPQDTLLAVGDSMARQTFHDRSDSSHRKDSAALRDSLDKAIHIADSLASALRMTDSIRRADSISTAIRQADSLAKSGKLKLPGNKGVKQRSGPPPGRGQSGPRQPGGPKPQEGSKPPAEMATEPIKPPVKTEPDKDHQSFVDTASARVTDTTLRYILGYHHVRIFSDSLQAVADSLYYSTQDSVFRLFKDPIAWGNGSYQVTGDTMYVYTKNKKANRLYVFENGLAINKVGKNFYNQIRGTTINTYFKNGDVDYMRAKGNAESIYYVKDDNNAYTGVNKAHADIIDMIFALKDDSSGRELRRVVLRNDAEGSMIPFKKVNFEEMRLRGFKWQESRRPKSKEELLLDPPAASATDIREKKDEEPAPANNEGLPAKDPAGKAPPPGGPGKPGKP